MECLITVLLTLCGRYRKELKERPYPLFNGGEIEYQTKAIYKISEAYRLQFDRLIGFGIRIKLIIGQYSGFDKKSYKRDMSILAEL